MKTLKNSDGFSSLYTLLILVIVGIIGFTGWYVWNANHEADKNLMSASQSSQPSSGKQKATTSKSTYDPERVSHIKDFDKASASFKAVLVGDIYDQGKVACSDESAADGTDLNTYVYMQKMVRDEFAQFQLCGSGGSAVYKKINDNWQMIGNLADGPSCVFVDKYHISNIIAPTCYQDEAQNYEQKPVMYE